MGIRQALNTLICSNQETYTVADLWVELHNSRSRSLLPETANTGFIENSRGSFDARPSCRHQ